MGRNTCEINDDSNHDRPVIYRRGGHGQRKERGNGERLIPADYEVVQRKQRGTMKRGLLISFVILVLLTNAFPSHALSSSSRSLHQGNIFRANRRLLLCQKLLVTQKNGNVIYHYLLWPYCLINTVENNFWWSDICFASFTLLIKQNPTLIEEQWPPNRRHFCMWPPTNATVLKKYSKCITVRPRPTLLPLEKMFLLMFKGPSCIV